MPRSLAMPCSVSAAPAVGSVGTPVMSAVGSTFTTLLAMVAAKEVDEILGVPDDSGFQLAGMLPMGYPRGRFGVVAIGIVTVVNTGSTERLVASARGRLQSLP